MAVKLDEFKAFINGVFLSRLCGGEVFHGRFNNIGYFLSRLCGGEVKNLKRHYLNKFSKPPMWR